MLNIVAKSECKPEHTNQTRPTKITKRFVAKINVKIFILWLLLKGEPSVHCERLSVLILLGQR